MNDAALAEAALVRLTEHTGSAGGPVIRPDGFAGLRQVMRVHANEGGVTRAGLAFIAALCDSEARRTAAANAGFYEVVLGAMGAHPARVEVQTAGCQALTALSSGELGGGRSKVAVVTLGALPVVVTALRSKASSPSLQANGCMAIAQLTSASDGPRLGFDAGALEVLVEALRCHPTHASVIHWGTTAMLRIVRGSEPRIERALALGARDVLTDVIEGASTPLGLSGGRGPLPQAAISKLEVALRCLSIGAEQAVESHAPPPSGGEDELMGEAPGESETTGESSLVGERAVTGASPTPSAASRPEAAGASSSKAMQVFGSLVWEWGARTSEQTFGQE